MLSCFGCLVLCFGSMVSDQVAFIMTFFFESDAKSHMVLRGQATQDVLSDCLA
jgi:hypothetical protein